MCISNNYPPFNVWLLFTIKLQYIHIYLYLYIIFGFNIVFTSRKFNLTANKFLESLKGETLTVKSAKTEHFCSENGRSGGIKFARLALQTALLRSVVTPGGPMEWAMFVKVSEVAEEGGVSPEQYRG